MSTHVANGDARFHVAGEHHLEHEQREEARTLRTVVVLTEEALIGRALAAAIEGSNLLKARYASEWPAARRMLVDPRGKALLWLADTMDEDAFERVTDLRAASPEVGLCLVARRFDLPGVHALAMHGVARLSLLLRTEQLGLADVVRALVRLKGHTVTLTPDVLRALARSARADEPPLGVLSQDERSVLAFAAMGLRNCEIAKRMHRSEKLIEKRIGCIFSKLGLNGDGSEGLDRRVAAARIYLLANAHADVIQA